MQKGGKGNLIPAVVDKNLGEELDRPADGAEGAEDICCYCVVHDSLGS